MILMKSFFTQFVFEDVDDIKFDGLDENKLNDFFDKI